MSRSEHICLMANYNEWMNAKVYAAAAKLPSEALLAHRKAYFGSILGTLNHLAVADTIWLKRFATHPANYPALDPVRCGPDLTHLEDFLFPDVHSLAGYRKALDAVIVAWAQTIAEPELDHVLHYANTKGVAASRNFHGLVTHFFNHQTHHRGQITTLLSQAGTDVGVTDLLALVADEAVI